MVRLRHKQWFVTHGAQDPIVGMLGAFTTTASSFINDLKDFKRDVSTPKPRKTSNNRNYSKQGEVAKDDPVREDKNVKTISAERRVGRASGKFASSAISHCFKGRSRRVFRRSNQSIL